MEKQLNKNSFEHRFKRTAMGLMDGGWIALINSTYSIENLEYIREYLQQSVEISENLYTGLYEQWAVDLSRAELRYCDRKIEQLREQKEE